MGKIINNKIVLTSSDTWDVKWEEIFNHYQQDTRHAYYIRAILNEHENKILEIGAGSFRDMAQLNKWGINCDGLDFSLKSVKMAKIYYPEIADKIINDDAFKTSIEDNNYDLSYHNGFWTYFSDEEIKRLIQEQARITRKRIVATVHNGHNKDFIKYFEKLSEKDDLYNLRFFEIEEMYELLKETCNNVTIIPVGKGKKYYEDDLINIGLGDAVYLKKSFNYHGMNLLENSERILCIGELKK